MSLTKLTTLLANHFYGVVSTYCVGNEVHFLEARTPKMQKTFVIRVPPKYKMEGNDENYKRFQVTHIPASGVPPTTRQLDYLMDIKGPLIDCDLLSISSTGMCLYKNNNDVDYYKIGEYDIPEDRSLPEEPEIGGVEQIIKEAAILMERLDPHEEESPPKEIREDPEAEKVETEEVDTPIELEFDDVESEPTPDKDEEKPSVLEDKEMDGQEGSLQVEKKPVQSRRDNALPPMLEDADIGLGIVYYSVDVGVFYKRAGSLEDEIIGVYDTLDDNEDALRESKISEITLLTERVVHKAKLSAEKIKQDEKALKAQLITLSAILEKTEIFQTKINTGDKKKFADVKPDIDRIHTQTRNTIYDINVELLRNRDAAEDILNSIQTSLEEILNI